MMPGRPDPLTRWLGLDFTGPERRYNPEIRDFLEHGLELGKIRVRYIGSLEVQPFPSDPSALPWWDAYTALKHRRHEALQRATLRHALQAVGALVTAITALAWLKRQGDQVVNLHPPPRVTYIVQHDGKDVALMAHINDEPYAAWHVKIPSQGQV